MKPLCSLCLCGKLYKTKKSVTNRLFRTKVTNCLTLNYDNCATYSLKTKEQR